MSVAQRKVPDSTNGTPPYDGETWQRQTNTEIGALWQVATTRLTSVSMSGNDVTASSDPALVAPIAAYAQPMSFWIIFPAPNTGGMTINIDGVGVINLKDKAGATLPGGAVDGVSQYLIDYDGTQCRVHGTGSSSSASANTAPDMIIRDEKSTGTGAGAFTSGGFAQRVLNTSVRNVLPGASLSGNQFTLQPGTYLIEWSAPAVQVGLHQTRLFNATDSITVETGSSASSSATSNIESVSFGKAVVTITSAKAFEIDHICQTTNGTNGLGLPTNLAAKEVYAWVNIWQVGSLPSQVNGVVGGAVTWPVIFDTTTTDADPGPGKLRLNNATQSSATTIFIDLLDANGTTLTSVIDSIGNGQVRLVKYDDPTKWIIFSITSWTTATGYRKYTVTEIGSASTNPFANGDRIYFAWSALGGAVGPTGLTGATGATGATGTVSAAGDGTVGAPGIAFASDTDTGIYRIGANHIGIAAGGAEVIDIAAAGIGITGNLGVTGAAAANQIVKITSNNAGGSEQPLTILNGSMATTNSIEFLIGRDFNQYGNTTFAYEWVGAINVNNYGWVGTSFNDRTLKWDSQGFVGVGRSTNNLSHLLEVGANFSVDSSGDIVAGGSATIGARSSISWNDVTWEGLVITNGSLTANAGISCVANGHNAQFYVQSAGGILFRADGASIGNVSTGGLWTLPNLAISGSTTSTSTTTGALIVSGGVGIAGALNVGGNGFFSGTFGYPKSLGVGGTVTQGSSSGKATSVTLNKSCGQITLNNAALAAGTIVAFDLTNSLIEAGDVLKIDHISGGTLGAYTFNAATTTSNVFIYVRNSTGGSLSEAIVLQYVLIKSGTT